MKKYLHKTLNLKAVWIASIRMKSKVSVLPVGDLESGIRSLLNCLSCPKCKRRLHRHVVLRNFPEQVLAPLVVPHNQIGDLHDVNNISQFPLVMQKPEVVEPGLSCGWRW